MTVSGQSVIAWSATRDDNGRIVTKTVGGITSDYVYDYDEMGQLLTVEKDGIIIKEYQ